MIIKHKFIITKQLQQIWRTGVSWENMKPSYNYSNKVLKVDFHNGNHIILIERDMVITVTTHPIKVQETFNIGDIKLLNKIEDFITENTPGLINAQN